MAKGFSRLVSLIFDRDAAQRVQEETAAALGRAGQLGGEELAKALEEGGRTATRALTKALTEEYNKTMTNAQVRLGKGLIDQKEFDRIKREADASFNAKLIPAMEKLRDEGKITEGEFQALARRIKKVGDDGPKEIGRVGAALETIKGKALALSTAFVGLFAIDRIKAFGKSAFAEFLGAEESVARLNAMVRANGGAVQLTGEQLVGFGKQLRSETKLQTEDIELAMSQLLTYHSISGETFKRTLRVAGDISAVYGGLSASTEALAKALDAPIDGLGALSKQGFKFEDATIAQVRALVLQNRQLEAQDVLLRELEGQIDGVSRGMKTGMGGALKELSDAWQDLKEWVGEAVVRMTDGESVVRRTTAAVIWMTRNADELVATLFALAKATLVVGGMMALGRFVIVVRSATTATIAFGAAARSLLASTGIGALAIAVGALTEAFRRSGEGAREAARQAREAAAEFKAALQSMTQDQLIMQAASLQARIDALNEQLRAELAASNMTGHNLGRVKELRDELAKLEEQQKQVAERYNQASGRTGGGAPTTEYLINEITSLKSLRDLRALAGDESRRLADAERQLSAMVRAGTLSREEEIKALQALKKERAGLKQELKDEKQLRDALDRREERAGAKGQLVTTNAPTTPLAGATWAEGRRRGGGSRFGSTIDAGSIGQRADAARNSVLSLDEVGAFERGFRSVMQNVQDVSADAAHNIASSFQDAFQLMLKEGASVGAFFSSIGRAIAGSMLGGIAQYATGKVKENVASAIEMGAKALGFAALGQVPSHAAAGASAGQHLAAAAAWGALAGGSGAGRGAVTGGAGAIPQNVRDVGLSTYASAERMPDQTVIYVQGFDPGNARHQDMLVQGMKNASRRDSSFEIRPWDGRVRK